MHRLEHRLQATIRKQELIRAGDRVAAAVSGGADSVALLLLLVELRAELGIAVSVAHVNHKLRGAESDCDEEFVRELAAEHGLEFACSAAVIQGRTGIENTARRLRYEYFRGLLADGKASKVATAHTLDDQAETVLLRMFRGTGIRGLGGIHPRLSLERQGRACGEVVRPLLGFRRNELREYLRARGQTWREDSSNQDESFLRNRVRGRLVPVIVDQFGDAALEHLAELAEIAREEEELSSQYSVLSTQQLGEATNSTENWRQVDGVSTNLDANWLFDLPLAAQRRVVRAWIEKYVPQARISFRLIESVLEVARERTTHEIEVPTGDSGMAQALSSERLVHPKDNHSDRNPWKIRTGPKELVIGRGSDRPADYHYVLNIPGELYVPELRVTISAEITKMEAVPEMERPGLLDPMRVGKEFIIRNWRPGDRYWPGHSKQPKKVKELLNDRHVTGAAKTLWPVAESKGEIVWLRDFAVADAVRARAGAAIWIRQRTTTS